MKYLYTIIFLILSGALFFLGIDPFRKDVKDLKSELVMHNQALDSSKALQKNQDDLIAKFNNIKSEDKTRLEHFLPDTVNNIRFILEVEQLATSHGMPISNIKFENNLEKKNTTKEVGSNMNEQKQTFGSNVAYGTFPIEFTVDGTYDTFLLFLKDIELNLRMLDIKSINFDSTPKNSSEKNSTGPVTLSFTLKVETYWLK